MTPVSRTTWGVGLICLAILAFAALPVLYLFDIVDYILYIVIWGLGVASLYEGIQVLRGRRTMTWDNHSYNTVEVATRLTLAAPSFGEEDEAIATRSLRSLLRRLRVALLPLTYT